MGFKCGIVGLPNVGKSTLFNALTASKNAEAANFPFCTIDPNIGIVDVVDERLDKLTELSKSKKKIYTNITFVDIAGLVKGASKGEGLGNKFLSHIREVDAIIHLVRCFESEKITHVNSKINPVEDLETIKTEIILSDIDIIQKKIEKGKKKLLEEKHIKILEEKLSHIKTPITLSIIGCVVNGPGEAALTDIGITGGGKGNNMLYLRGVQSEKVLTGDIIDKVVFEVEKKASELEKINK